MISDVGSLPHENPLLRQAPPNRGGGVIACGVDASPAMLASPAIDGRAGLSAHLKPARLERFRFRRRFDLARCLVSTFKYLQTEEAALAHLRRMAKVRRPGGMYALGMRLSDYADHCRS